ncbi:WD40 repeat domain-containing protein [Xanthomonas albilineans]|uniref:WD40 repeat domain-containing protein n=1 Tax=Xanthomonas albilineans TaxID=29447 RepID=UPI0027D9552D|nr:WD40 repeat domain-containing protein [Xanthomonas albilineans]
MKMPSQQRTSTSIPTQSATGFTMQVDAVPVAAVMCGTRLVTAWGDGSVRRFAREQAPDRVQVHDGAILTLAADATGGLLSGGDDGVFAHLDATGQQVLARFPGQWVEHVAASADGHYACAVGRQVHLWRTDGSTQVMDHPSSVGGIAFDPNGQRLAVTHYGGATVWTHAPGDWTPTPLACRGSHLGVTWSPDGRFVVSSMQETALHGWRVGDALQLHIAGYATKVRQWCWVGTKPWLASSGATSAVLWPFDGINGPMQRAPLTLFDTPQQIWSARYARSPINRASWPAEPMAASYSASQPHRSVGMCCAPPATQRSRCLRSCRNRIGCSSYTTTARRCGCRCCCHERAAPVCNCRRPTAPPSQCATDTYLLRSDHAHD